VLSEALTSYESEKGRVKDIDRWKKIEAYVNKMKALD